MVKSKSNDTIDQIDRFHQTKKGRIIFGLAELLLAYLFVSLAIESGSIWQYLVAILLTIGAVNNLVRAFVPSKLRSYGKKSGKK